MDQSATVYRQMTRLAWRNVLRNWRHSLATILAIASGFMAVSLFDGFIKELQYRNNDGYMARGMLGNVVIQKAGAQQAGAEDQWLYSLDAKDQRFLQEQLASDPDVAAHVRFLFVTGLVNAGPYNTVFSGYAYDLKEGADVRGPRWNWNTTAGKPLDPDHPDSLLLGQGLGKLIDCESNYKGPPIVLDDGSYRAEDRPYTCKYPRVTLSATTEASQVNAVDLPISGLFDAGFREMDKRAVRLSLAQGQRLLDTDKISMVTVKLKNDDQLAAFLDRTRAAASKNGLQLEIIPWTEHKLADYVRGGLQILNVFRNLFMTIVVTIGVMSVANTMMKSVNERIREIGTLRSIGFLRRHLVYMFSMEGAFLSLIACALGLALTLVMTFIVDHLGLSYRAGILSVAIALKLALSPVAWIASTVVLSILATGTAWFCARRAARMVIADAMRHV